MKRIVIAGGGFAGISTALTLDKQLPRSAETEITLIDRHPYHLGHTYLYEVATSPEELTTLAQLRQSLAVPIVDILAGTRVKFQQATIKQVDPKQREITLEQGKLFYDYLVLALGSSSNFYGIPGADRYSIPLKSIRDSFAIRNRIGFLLDTHRQDMTKDKIRIVVAGGGFAGVEIAAELKGLLDFLSWKEEFPRQKLQVMVVEGSSQLMPGLGEEVGRDVYLRLKDFGFEIMLNSLITNVEANSLEFKNGERLNYDCLIWTAGVKANQVPFTEEMAVDRGNRMVVNAMFQLESYPSVFVLGDEGCYMGTDGRPLPGTARQAIDQGKYAGYAIAQLLQNKKPRDYKCKNYGYIVPLGGKWAILKTQRFYLKGFFAYLARQLAWFHYFWTILGLRKAFKLAILENRLYGRND
jgi:NADH:ubiquinone reductase (H+-translocating)